MSRSGCARRGLTLVVRRKVLDVGVSVAGPMVTVAVVSTQARRRAQAGVERITNPEPVPHATWTANAFGFAAVLSTQVGARAVEPAHVDLGRRVEPEQVRCRMWIPRSCEVPDIWTCQTFLFASMMRQRLAFSISSSASSTR